jgi:uncharacterized protein YndB with AHSA1/START domain
MSELVVRRSMAIHAPAQTIWGVLTDNAFIPQYMFGCTAETDWQPGSPLLWKGAADGKLYVKGAIVTFDAPHVLRYTTIDPNNPEVPDLAENYLTMSFIIREEKGGCTLEMVADGFNTVAKGAERYQEVNAGDDSLLLAIKNIAENQAGRAD